MIQFLEGNVNLFNFNLEEVEIEKVVELWHPQAQESIISIQDGNIVKLQSVNEQTQFVEIGVMETEPLFISFTELKEQYVPVLTLLQTSVLMEESAPEYEGLKEKLSQMSLES